MRNTCGPNDFDKVSSIWALAFREAGVAFLAAAVLLVIIYGSSFRWIHPEFLPFMDRGATTLIAKGKDFLPISAGRYHVDGETAVIESFNNDEAILALPRSFQAEDYPFIKVNVEGFTRYSKFKILWRRGTDLSTTHALTFNRSGTQATQISMVAGNENYRGQIADVALLFYDGPALGFQNNNGSRIVVSSIELRPFSVWRVAEQIFEDWTNPPLWQGYSNNVVRGIHANGMLFPNWVAHLLVVVGMFIVVSYRVMCKGWLRNATNSPIVAVALCLCLLGWGFNDALRWHWRIEQFIDTYERYAGLSLDQRIRNNDIRCARFPEDCAAHLLPYF